MEASSKKSLPENAYRTLNPGEEYAPIVPASSTIAEFTGRSLALGLVMAAVFSAAAAFLGLKVGQVFEAAIPISILAVGLGYAFRRRSTILENVIVQSVGAASGLVVAGSIFTLPALFILGLDVNLVKLSLVALLGGILGILFLIPLRRYFVREMHGEFPFPEATATTEVLVAGEAGGKQAKVLALAAAVGGIFDFLIIHMEAFAEVFTTRSVKMLDVLAEKSKVVFKLDVLSSVMGLGYIIGLKYSAIICAGSFLSWFLLVPMVGHFGAQLTVAIPPAADGTLIGAMSAEQIFRTYVRHIGIGGIAAAGILGILRSWRIIAKAFSLGFKELLGGKAAAAADGRERTDRDFQMKNVLIGLIITAIALWVFFRFGVVGHLDSPLKLSLIALGIVVIISFLFTTVAARAIAVVGTNPVSGMTLMTLILTSVFLAQAGLTGRDGMLAALLMGGVVCTALSMAGGAITDFKVGYWIGATPAIQQRSKILGTLVASFTVGSVILLLNQAYGFVPSAEHSASEVLVAPQANAMAAVIKTLMSNEPVPWLLYGIGALIALTMQMIGVPALAFALGMYIPMELNTPLVVGGLVAEWVQKSAGKDEKLRSARSSRGMLIASGFIAGGAIMGVVAALLKFLKMKMNLGPLGFSFGNAEGTGAELLALALYAGLAAYMFWDSCRAKAEEE
ncbi:MAG: oligopeptide transporter, OPT family [Thermoanaerobaculia bacterium]|nr:oligopeptide transporter, OPT family [Thermoanaerobaculia bacterium]